MQSWNVTLMLALFYRIQYSIIPRLTGTKNIVHGDAPVLQIAAKCQGSKS